MPLKGKHHNIVNCSLLLDSQLLFLFAKELSKFRINETMGPLKVIQMGHYLVDFLSLYLN